MGNLVYTETGEIVAESAGVSDRAFVPRFARCELGGRPRVGVSRVDAVTTKCDRRGASSDG